MCNFEIELCEIGVTQEIAKKIIEHFSGEMIYIPKKANRIDKRNAEIRELFSGKNYKEVARRFDMTTRQIRVILEKP